MLRIAVIGGDGIGPEVCEQGLRCLEVLAEREGITYRTTHLPYSGQRYLDQGVVITGGELAQLKTDYDVIYLGAVGRPQVPPGVLERGLLLKLRFAFDQYINLRPIKLYPGVETPLAGKGPGDIDFVVVRENTEGLYCGSGGWLRKGTEHEVAVQEMIATRMGVARCLRYAFDLCRARREASPASGGQPRGKLTLVGKSNVLTYAQELWVRTFEEVGSTYPDITREYHHVDACCMYMVTQPQIYDVIVTENMFGDIITDLGAAIAGGMGVAASGNLNPLGHAPSMFEPVHGSAPDIAGRNEANPIAAIASMAMLLQQSGLMRQDMGMIRAGDRLEAAVAAVCATFAGHPLDRLPYSTRQVGDRVIRQLNHSDV